MRALVKTEEDGNKNLNNGIKKREREKKGWRAKMGVIILPCYFHKNIFTETQNHTHIYYVFFTFYLD